MGNKEYINEIAPDVAAKLASDLHSSAEENIISSMLTACLNESKTFMKWFCHDKAGFLHGNNDFGKLWATANDRIPPIITKDNSCSYQRPDILIWQRQDESDWEKAFEATTDEEKKVAIRKVRAVFVEVKKTFLDEANKEKYKRFVDCISRRWRGKHEFVRFIIVSAHDELTAARIRNSRQSNARTEEERLWIELLKSQRGQIGPFHISFEEVFKELNENKRAYRECHLIPIFKSYMALYTAQVDDMSYRKSWEYLVKYHRNDYVGLRREIVDSVRGLATVTGIAPERVRNLEGKMKKANLITIKEQAGGKYRLSLSDEPPDEVPEDELHVKIRKGGWRIKFRFSDGSADNIADKMRKVRDKILELRQY